MGVGGERHAPATLPPGKTLYPLYEKLGGPPGPAWTRVENLAPTGIRSPDLRAHSESLYQLSYPGPQQLRYSYVLLVNNAPTVGGSGTLH
jgi:hypothetical protein